EQRVVAEPRDDDAHPLGGADDQLTLRCDDLLAVDRQPHVPLGHLGLRRLGRLLVRKCHAEAPTSSRLLASHSATNSSRKYLMPLWIGLTAPSPSPLNERPRMLSQTSRMVSMSSSVPRPSTSRSRIWARQSVPSRHGVHLPQDSCS